jgi:hypothetical protein
VGGQQIFVDARAVVEALGVAGRHQLDEVVIPLVAGRQQRQVVVGLANPRARLVVPTADGNIRFTAEDRLEALGTAGVVELDRAEHVAVVGDRHRLHAELRAALDDLADAAGAVKQAELGVQVKMNKLRHGHRAGWRL